MGAGLGRAPAPPRKRGERERSALAAQHKEALEEALKSKEEALKTQEEINDQLRSANEELRQSQSNAPAES